MNESPEPDTKKAMQERDPTLPSPLEEKINEGLDSKKQVEGAEDNPKLPEENSDEEYEQEENNKKLLGANLKAKSVYKGNNLGDLELKS